MWLWDRVKKPLFRGKIPDPASNITVGESQKLFADLIETAGDGFVIIDRKGTIRMANKQAELLFGYDRAEMQGKPIELLIPERYHHVHVKHRTGYIEHPRTRPMGQGLELFGRRKDGSEFPVDISLSEFRAGERLLATAVIRDVSDHKRTLADLQKSRDRLDRLATELESRNTALVAANKELEAFSYSVSHDLRAPLRSLDGFSRALLEEYADKLDAAGKDYLERIRAAAQRMGQLIDDLLNLSRLSRKEMVLAKVDLSAMAMKIAEEYQKSEPQRQARFLIADGVIVRGDRDLLRVVMENLFSNAWKFTSRHPSATIEFGVERKAGQPVYFVRDDGAGFDMAYAQKLFGAFQRLHRAADFPGTGVGLATVQRIVLRHGGSIWADGGVERGATFRFSLRTPVPAAEEPKKEKAA